VTLVSGAWTLSRGDAAYPTSLHDLADPPAQLRVAGNVPDLTCAVAIVGTRSADDAALDFAFALARDLVSAGWVVVSGAARGIDGAAHRGALTIGHTLAVLGSGLARPYPPEHAGLLADVVKNGAVVTELGDSCPPLPARFLQRNRIIAALARAVVVVSAPRHSGAVNTARHAMALKRQVFCVPGAPWDPRFAGSLALLREGAMVCTSPSDVLSVAARGGPDPGSEPPRKIENQCKFKDVDPRLEQVLRAVEGCPRHVDEIVRATGLPVARVQQALLALVLRGLVVERSGGRFGTPRACTRRRY
jgi:DNA processing protein